MAGVEIWVGRPDANIVGPSGRLHKQHCVTFSHGNILKPRLALIRVPGMFLQHCFYLFDSLGTLLPKDLVSDGGGRHVAGDVPSRNGKQQYGKREKY